MKNNLEVALHARERGNEGASLKIYETLEITAWGLLLNLIARARGRCTLMPQATRATFFR